MLPAWYPSSGLVYVMEAVYRALSRLCGIGLQWLWFQGNSLHLGGSFLIAPFCTRFPWSSCGVRDGHVLGFISLGGWRYLAEFYVRQMISNVIATQIWSLYYRSTMLACLAMSPTDLGFRHTFPLIAPFPQVIRKKLQGKVKVMVITQR